MLSLSLLAATPGYVVPPGLAALSGLHGCWRVSGQVQGKDAPAIARGEWRLGRRYFTLHLRAGGAEPYEAAITYGAGERPQAIGSVFSDTVGGMYGPSWGSGEITGDGFVQRYRFPDTMYLNRFARAGRGWRWSIFEQTPGKADVVFADYRLAAASCRGMRFDY